LAKDKIGHSHNKDEGILRKSLGSQYTRVPIELKDDKIDIEEVSRNDNKTPGSQSSLPSSYRQLQRKAVVKEIDSARLDCLLNKKRR
jgi:hypothetical protein